jgi:hypothetical protein
MSLFAMKRPVTASRFIALFLVRRFLNPIRPFSFASGFVCVRLLRLWAKYLPFTNAMRHRIP